MAIGVDLTLVSIDAVSGRTRFGPAVAFALAVGELVDLALLGRVALRDDHLVAVRQERPVGEPLLDKALAWLAAEQSQPPTVSQWVAERGPWRIDEYVFALEEAGVLRLVPIDPPTAGVKRIEVKEAQRIHAAVDRLSNAIMRGDAAPYEEQAFATLTAAAGCAREHLRGWNHRADRKRLREVSESACQDNDSDAAARTILGQGIQALRTHAKQAGGSSRTIDEQIGLTEAGKWAAISYYSDNFPP